MMTEILAETIELAYNMELHLLLVERLISRLMTETEIYQKTYTFDNIEERRLIEPPKPKTLLVERKEPEIPRPPEGIEKTRKNKKKYDEYMENYRKEKEEYDEYCKYIEIRNAANLDRYNKAMVDYNRLKEERINKANMKNILYHHVKIPIIISKIKLLTRSYEKTRMMLDYIYQQNGLDYAYRDVVSLYVFRYYLKKGLVNSSDMVESLIAKYKKDEELNNIPMQTDLKDVKMIKNKVDVLVEEFQKTIQDISDISQNKNTSVDRYISEQKKMVISNFNSVVEYYINGSEK